MSMLVVMPKLGLNMESGIITRWMKSAGDYVTKGEVIAEIETDKITSEVQAETDGYLTEILAAEGDEIPVGEPICVIDNEAK